MRRHSKTDVVLAARAIDGARLRDVDAGSYTISTPTTLVHIRPHVVGAIRLQDPVVGLCGAHASESMSIDHYRSHVRLNWERGGCCAALADRLCADCRQLASRDAQ